MKYCALLSIFAMAFIAPTDNSVLAQSMYERQQQFGQDLRDIQNGAMNRINLIIESEEITKEADSYYKAGNRKSACFAIQQAYSLEQQALISSAVTRQKVRKYCG